MAVSQELEEHKHHSVVCGHDINKDIWSPSTGECPTLQCEDSKHVAVEVEIQHYDVILVGELIVSKYVAESITMIAGCFGHVGLCQLHTKLKKLQCETCYIANTGQWCCVMKSGCVNDQ